MNEYCVVTVDSARARFFILMPARESNMEPGPSLVEQGEDLINAEAHLSGHELWSDTPAGGMAHTYDDHRDQHVEEFKRRFAKQVAEQAVRLAVQNRAKTLVVVSEKHMLGLLRNALNVPSKATFEVREFPKDLCRLGPQELHTHLAAKGILPPHRRPT